MLQFASPTPQSPPARGGEVVIESTNIFVVYPTRHFPDLPLTMVIVIVFFLNNLVEIRLRKGKKMRVLSMFIAVCLFGAITPVFGFAAGFNVDMTKYLKSLEAEAKKQDSGFKGFDSERGKKLFFEVRPNEKSGPISCATCHTSDLKKSGKTLVGKAIDPLAPSVNKNRLSNVKEVEKWLTRNFKQVFGREGTAREKGDVLQFINAQ